MDPMCTNYSNVYKLSKLYKCTEAYHGIYYNTVKYTVTVTIGWTTYYVMLFGVCHAGVIAAELRTAEKRRMFLTGK